jgi:hypothetical protein
MQSDVLLHGTICGKIIDTQDKIQDIEIYLKVFRCDGDVMVLGRNVQKHWSDKRIVYVKVFTKMPIDDLIKYNNNLLVISIGKYPLNIYECTPHYITGEEPLEIWIVEHSISSLLGQLLEQHRCHRIELEKD